MKSKDNSQNSPMKYEKDHHGHEMLTKEKELQVMMEWEKPYMKACVEALKPSGDVLEIGFGLGYSATYFQQHKIKSHTIVECDPVVVKKAKEWAKQYSNVKIIEDTWQNALDKLGVFDVVFFDDYPLETMKETQALNNFSKEGSLVLVKGQQLLADIHLQFPFLDHIEYKDEDLEYFFNHIRDSKAVDTHYYLPFFYDLKMKKNISDIQFNMIADRLVSDRLIDKKIKDEFIHETKHRKPSQHADFNARGDRLFTFLEKCIKKHMRIGSRFSCFLEDPTSKYQNEKFHKHIITNPALDYHEHSIDVKVPSHCKYYTSDKALVIVITKMA